MNHRTNIKAAVTAAFSAAADTYDASADVQQDVAAKLAGRIKALPLPPRPRILEIGCGTGFLSRHLLDLAPVELLLTDISPAMLESCRRAVTVPTARFMVLDGEQPEAAGERFDLICSSFVFQWFHDMPAALQRLRGLLAPGGQLMFATLGAESFREWKAAHAALGLPAGVRDYPACADIAAYGTCTDEILTRPYTDGHRFLDHLKQIGAHLPEERHRPLTAGALRSVLRRFAGGIDVTYHILYGSVRSTS